MNFQVQLERLNERVFEALYSRALVYNACWEDPAIDRQVLNIHSTDTMVVIASAGCNVPMASPHCLKQIRSATSARSIADVCA